MSGSQPAYHGPPTPPQTRTKHPLSYFLPIGAEDDNDRDGVGCFLKENRTLWAGGVPVLDEGSTRERVRRNFGEWGRISSVRLVKNKVSGIETLFPPNDPPAILLALLAFVAVFCILHLMSDLSA